MATVMADAIRRIQIFSFGYEGWGNATPELVRSIDAVELERGYEPPIFVDVRIRRSGRAVGFRDSTFEEYLGEARYRWMRDLGNDSILTGEDEVRIHDPAAAAKLLALATEASDERRRIIYFCHCPTPSSCHRRNVGDLLLSAAGSAHAGLKLEEWPGGEPSMKVLRVDSKMLRQVRRGRRSVQLGSALPATDLLGLPWGSAVELRAEDGSSWITSGPARFSSGQWFVPALEGSAFSGAEEAHRAGQAFREKGGYDSRRR